MRARGTAGVSASERPKCVPSAPVTSEATLGMCGRVPVEACDRSCPFGLHFDFLHETSTSRQEAVNLLMSSQDPAARWAFVGRHRRIRDQVGPQTTGPINVCRSVFLRVDANSSRCVRCRGVLAGNAHTNGESGLGGDRKSHGLARREIIPI